MLFSNRRAALFLLSAVAALLLVSRIPRRPRDVPRTRELRTDASLENAPGDAGAGLSAILAISLPKSTERRQMMTEMAALTGLKVEFIDATTSAASQVNLTRQVLGESVGHLKDYVVATWWSHFTAWQTIVARFPPPVPDPSARLESLLSDNSAVENVGKDEPRILILEDDAGWELDIATRLPILMKAAERPRSDEYGSGDVAGWNLMYAGWCYEFPTTRVYDPPVWNRRPLDRIWGYETIPGYDKIPARTYEFARPVFPACLHAYIITPSTALHLLSTSLPAHVLQPSLFHKSPYKPFPFPKWDAIDIWLSNKPAKNALYTVVLHPPVFWQVANGKAQGPSELLNSVRAEVLKRQGRVESDEEKKKIEKERGEREEDKRKGIVQLPDGWTIQD